MVKEKNYVEKKKKEKTKGKIRFRRFDGINLILDSFPLLLQFYHISQLMPTGLRPFRNLSSHS